MKHLLSSFVLVGSLLLMCQAAGAGDYVEDWNVAGSSNANWKYWTTTGADMTWHPTDGVGSSGYVSTPLSSLLHWPLEDSSHTNYWPAYTMDGERSSSQNLQLFSGTQISVDLRSGAGLDLQGGSVHFFVGEWQSSWMAFYYNKASLSIGSGDWTHTSFLAGAAEDWGIIYRAGTSAEATDFFSNPQQYGLVILNATGHPLGILDVDNLSVIPEPTSGSLAVLCLCLLGFARFSRR